jgi:hypothetical protein
MECPICAWRDATRYFQERDWNFDAEGSIVILDIMERNAGSHDAREFTRLGDAANSAKRAFEGFREDGNRLTFTHRERERNGERSSTAVREEWVRGVRRKIDRLKDCMKETHKSYGVSLA